jgi:acetoin utilization protein AcuB
MKSSRAKVAKEKEDWTVAAFMTPQPVTIGRRELLATAHRLMRSNAIRHLPVLEHGDLVGMVTQRDLYFLETIRGVDIEEDVVEDAMTTDTYDVAPETPVATVAKLMARKRYGCAVVMERGRVAGIFTATDALRLLAAIVPMPAPAPRAAARTAPRRAASATHTD